MNRASLIKVNNKKYRLVPEADYLKLLCDLKDLGKVLKRASETGMEAGAFFKGASANKK